MKQRVFLLHHARTMQRRAAGSGSSGVGSRIALLRPPRILIGKRAISSSSSGSGREDHHLMMAFAAAALTAAATAVVISATAVSDVKSSSRSSSSSQRTSSAIQQQQPPGVTTNSFGVGGRLNNIINTTLYEQQQDTDGKPSPSTTNPLFGKGKPYEVSFLYLKKNKVQHIIANLPVFPSTTLALSSCCSTLPKTHHLALSLASLIFC